MLLQLTKQTKITNNHVSGKDSLSSLRYFRHIILLILIIAAPLDVFYFKIAWLPINIVPIRIAILIGVLSGILIFFNRNIVTKYDFKIIVVFFGFILCSTYTLLNTTLTMQESARFFLLQTIVRCVLTTLILIFNKDLNDIEFSLRLIVISMLIVSFWGILDMILYFFLGVSLFNFFGDYNPMNYYRVIAVIKTQYGLVLRNSGTFSDPNLYSYFGFMPFAILLLFYFKSKRNKALLSCLFVFFSAVCSFSRSGILCTIILLFAWLLLTYKRNKFFISLLLLLVIYFIISNNIITQIFTGRMSDIAIDEVRKLRLEAGILSFFQSPILGGEGFNEMQKFFPAQMKNTDIITSHCFYIDILAHTGIIGFAIFFSPIIIVLIQLGYLSFNYNDIYSYIFFFVLLMLMITQFIYSNFLHSTFIIQIALLIKYAHLKTKYYRKNRICNARNKTCGIKQI